MLQVEFTYPIGDRMIKIVAKCKEVTEESMSGLSLTFMDNMDNVVRIPYDAGLFEDIEDEALSMLSELYYNPELNFSHH